MSGSSPRSWVFQANPKLYDIDGALENLEQIRWSIRQHKTAIKNGDRVFLWRSGPGGGLIGRAWIIDGPQMMPSVPKEKRFQKAAYSDADELRAVIRIDKIIDPPVPRKVFIDDPGLRSMAHLRSPQGTNFALTDEEAHALNSLCDAPAEASHIRTLSKSFRQFSDDPAEQLRIQVRRERARQLRKLLQDPDAIDLDVFNQDVWNFETSTLLHGEEIKGKIFGEAGESLDFQKRVNRALADGSLELHGNYTWGAGARIYGSRLKIEPERKREHIREVIRVFNDRQIPPIEKAKQIQEVPGFGPNMATGLVMMAHPNEFSIWNKPSKEALARLGYEADELSAFQDIARLLKEELGADDFIELDRFLYLVSHDQSGSTSDDEAGPEDGSASDGVRSWAISLGEGGRLWKQCLHEGVIAIGWDYLGDLRQYKSKEEFADAIAAYRDDGHHPMNDSHACYQFTYEMKPGDLVFAKKGMDQLYGVGVIGSDYEHVPDRAEYRSVRRVQWTREGSWTIPDDARVPLKTLTEVTDYQRFQEFVKPILRDKSDQEPAPDFEPYTIEMALRGLFVSENRFKEMLDALSRKKNVILQGPPGVGKTFISRRLAYAQIGEKDASKTNMVQFHQSYSYEDFIQGWRPHEGGGFRRRNGVFHEFCKRAEKDQGSNYVFLIDEINRGNLSKIFGELLMLIEADKRGPEFGIPLTYSDSLDETFFIPSNVHIIGMMNTADRSLAMVDYALRRRFTFIDLRPEFESDRFRDFLDEQNVEAEVLELILERMSSLNEKIRSEVTNLGPGFEIGHSFFCPHDTEDALGIDWYRAVVRSEIAPLLREYWFDDAEKAEQLVRKLLR